MNTTSYEENEDVHDGDGAETKVKKVKKGNMSPRIYVHRVSPIRTYPIPVFDDIKPKFLGNLKVLSKKEQEEKDKEVAEKKIKYPTQEIPDYKGYVKGKLNEDSSSAEVTGGKQYGQKEMLKPELLTPDGLLEYRVMTDMLLHNVDRKQVLVSNDALFIQKFYQQPNKTKPRIDDKFTEEQVDWMDEHLIEAKNMKRKEKEMDGGTVEVASKRTPRGQKNKATVVGTFGSNTMAQQKKKEQRNIPPSPRQQVGKSYSQVPKVLQMIPTALDPSHASKIEKSKPLLRHAEKDYPSLSARSQSEKAQVVECRLERWQRRSPPIQESKYGKKSPRNPTAAVNVVSGNDEKQKPTAATTSITTIPASAVGAKPNEKRAKKTQKDRIAGEMKWSERREAVLREVSGEAIEDVDAQLLPSSWWNKKEYNISEHNKEHCEEMVVHHRRVLEQCLEDLIYQGNGLINSGLQMQHMYWEFNLTMEAARAAGGVDNVNQMLECGGVRSGPFCPVDLPNQLSVEDFCAAPPGYNLSMQQAQSNKSVEEGGTAWNDEDDGTHVKFHFIFSGDSVTQMKRKGDVLLDKLKYSSEQWLEKHFVIVESELMEDYIHDEEDSESEAET